VIDLHLHTTASDGRATPRQLVDRASAAGIAVLSVTDHDTVAALAETAGAAVSAGLAFVPGIEITTVWNGSDVHVLGYFVNPGASRLVEFLAAQRADRIRRVRAIARRLDELGLRIDVDHLLREVAAEAGRSVGRPQIGRALVQAGYVTSLREAFDRYLGEGKAAFVPRHAPPPEAGIELVAEAGGISSLAHPGLLGHDDIIPGLARAGLDAIEVYHNDHARADRERYLALAAEHGLAVTGGSDYHAEAGYGAQVLGVVALPADAFGRLVERARCRRIVP